MSMSSKIFFLVAIISATFFYSHVSKRKFDHLRDGKELVLKNLPDIKLTTFEKGSEELKEQNVSTILSAKDKGMYVHFWGTWCAPCEVEFPEFLQFAESLKQENVRFLIVAVNDEIKKVNKFLKRFKEVPENVVFALDNTSNSMDYFGTVKVPETYLFDNKGVHLTKFVGPQDWANTVFAKRTVQLLNKIESAPIKQISTN